MMPCCNCFCCYLVHRCNMMLWTYQYINSVGQSCDKMKHECCKLQEVFLGSFGIFHEVGSHLGWNIVPATLRIGSSLVVSFILFQLLHETAGMLWIMPFVAKHAFVSLVNVLVQVGKSNVLWCIKCEILCIYEAKVVHILSENDSAVKTMRST